MHALAGPWKCTPQNVYDLFYRSNPLGPQHIDAAAVFLRLDEFDTNELRLLGAREAGWNIDPEFLVMVPK